MKDYIERWNKWRKHNTNSTIYKMLVFFGILHSPTFERTLSDEEEAELSEAFKNAVEEGKRYMEDYISRKEAIRLIMEYQGGAMDKPTARKVLENMGGVEICEDTISRQAAIDVVNAVFPVDPNKSEYASGIACGAALAVTYIKQLPSAQPEIIRCKDCRWWDKYGDGTHGYCMAAKHGHWSTHWEISIRRTYDGDWFCADAERREDEG